MWILLRIATMSGFLYALYKAMQEDLSPHADDLTPAFYLGLSVILAILAAISWAPYLGEKISGPLTGTYLKGNFTLSNNRVLQMIRWLDARQYRRCALLLCFLEGVRKPSAPTHFAIGLQNAQPGSWLEKVYAREVFKFDNVQNCVEAYKILQQHGIDPRPHRNPEINIVLLSLEKSVQATPEPLALPPAPPPPPLHRNERIRLFNDPPPESAENQTARHQPG